jgi:hypothetical protein
MPKLVSVIPSFKLLAHLTWLAKQVAIKIIRIPGFKDDDDSDVVRTINDVRIPISIPPSVLNAIFSNSTLSQKNGRPSTIQTYYLSSVYAGTLAHSPPSLLPTARTVMLCIILNVTPLLIDGA